MRWSSSLEIFKMGKILFVTSHKFNFLPNWLSKQNKKGENLWGALKKEKKTQKSLK